MWTNNIWLLKLFLKFHSLCVIETAFQDTITLKNILHSCFPVIEKDLIYYVELFKWKVKNLYINLQHEYNLWKKCRKLFQGIMSHSDFVYSSIILMSVEFNCFCFRARLSLYVDSKRKQYFGSVTLFYYILIFIIPLSSYYDDDQQNSIGQQFFR